MLIECLLDIVQNLPTTTEQMVYVGDVKAIQNIQSSTVISLWKGFDIIYQKNLGTSTVTKYFVANGLRIAWNELLINSVQRRL